MAVCVYSVYLDKSYRYMLLSLMSHLHTGVLHTSLLLPWTFDLFSGHLRKLQSNLQVSSRSIGIVLKNKLNWWFSWRRILSLARYLKINVDNIEICLPGHSCSLQLSKIEVTFLSGHSSPPWRAVWFIVRVRVLVPPPQDKEQSSMIQAFHAQWTMK